MEGLDHDYGLTLRSGGGDTAPIGPWADLARALDADVDAAADDLVKTLNSSPQAFLIGHRVYGAVKQQVTEPGQDPDAAYARASTLIVGLKPDVLASAFMSQTNLGDRRNTLKKAVDVISPAAVHALAIAAAAAYTHPASEVLDLLLKKLETEVHDLTEPARQQADQAFRSLVHHLIHTWSASTVDTTATGFEHLFETEAETAVSSVMPEPERIVYLALETGAVGSVLWTAVSELSADDNLRRLLGMLKDAPEGSRAAEMIAQQFANPQRLSLLLREDPVDFEAVDALLKHMQVAGADTLLNELIQSNNRTVRRGIIERLARLGPAIEPNIIERLKDERWFVLRNMLHVLHESGAPLTRVPVASYQTHADPRVRREAMQLLFKDPIARDRALANAFKESDPAMLRVALKAARSGLPDAGVPVLAKRILDPDFPPEFRIPSIQLLGRSKSLLALDSLLKYVAGGTTLLGKPKLAAKTPEMIAALKGLARTWSNERRAKVLIDLASTSNDPQIVAAAEGGKSTDLVKDIEDDGVE
jgi:hypothetical protein